MVHLVQTVHLSCTYANTVSEWTKTRFHMTTSSRSSIGCVQNDFRAYGTIGANRAPILRQYYHYLQTDRNELSVEPRHLVVPSGVSKTIPGPMVRLVQIVHQSCTDANTVSKWILTRFDMTHITLEYHRELPKRFLTLWYIWFKPCTYLAPTLPRSPNRPK